MPLLLPRYPWLPLLAAAAAWLTPLAGAPPPEAPTWVELTPVAPFRTFDRHNSRGLPQSTVNALVQDREGTLWLGTQDGVARFEGTEMEDVIPPPPHPHFGSVNTLIARQRGGVLVASSSGVHAYDGRQWRLISPEKAVIAMGEESNGRIWLVTVTGLVLRSVPQDDTIWSPMLDLPLVGPAYRVKVGRGDRVWIGARGNVILWTNERAEALPPWPVSTGALTAMLADAEDGCWIGGQNGEVWHGGMGRPWQPAASGKLPTSSVMSFALDKQNRLWCGLLNGSLAHASAGGAWTIWGAEQGLRYSVGILALLADREGTLWVGENGRGVQQLVSNAWRHRTMWETADRSIPVGAIFGLAPTHDGGMLAAVFSAGVWRWDGRRVWQYGAAEGLGESTMCVAEPEPGVIWVGSRGGLYESRAGGRFSMVLQVPGGFVSGIFGDPAGLWYACTTTQGIYEHRQGQWRAADKLNHTLAGALVRGMTWMRNGELWLSSSDGVRVLRPDTFEITAQFGADLMPTPTRCVVEMTSGEIWVAGTGGIAVRRDGAWRRITMRDGLPGRTIYAMKQAPDGAVWVGGGAGVGCYRNGRWITYNAHNGLIEDECNVNGLITTRDGAVYVGTMGGLARFDPTVTEPPLPALQCYWRQRPEPDASGVAHLTARDRTLRLAWKAPWLAPVPVEYRSRVRPLSEEWSAPTQRSDLQIENLGPGLWTIEVQARLTGVSEGGWSPTLETRVNIAPRFTETLWAKLLAALALVGVIAGVVRLWTWRLARRGAELNRVAQEAQANVKTLRGLIPICACCKKIRDDRGAWNQLEAYVHANSEAEFSHGFCPECMHRLYPDIPHDEKH